MWARVHLGRNWGTPMSEKVDAELVTTGPYHYIRKHRIDMIKYAITVYEGGTHQEDSDEPVQSLRLRSVTPL